MVKRNLARVYLLSLPLKPLRFVLLLALFASHSAYSQRHLADSLRDELARLTSGGVSETDTSYINVLNELAFSYQRINPDTSLMWAEKSEELSTAIGYAKGRSEALRNRGIVHYLRGDFPPALSAFYEALQSAESVHYEKGIGRIYNNIGLIYYGQSKYEEALDAQFKSIAIKEKIGDRPGLATSLNNIANIYKNQQRYSESLDYHFKSLAIKRGLNDTRSIAASLNNIAWLFIHQKNHRDALTYFKEAELLNREVQDKVVGSDVAQGMAECYLDLRAFDQALQYAQEGLAIARSIQLKDQLRDCNETLSKIYKAMGNHRAALQHFEVFKLYADSINSAEIEKRTSILEAEYEFAQRESQLKVAQEERDNEHEKQRLQQWWIIFSVLIGLTLVSFFAILLFRSRKKIQRAFEKLEEANHKARSKSEALRVSNNELQLQKEEIATQRDVMGEQNRKLQEASETIEKQNEEIRRRIENLESEVENRTRELLEYNQRLEQFAFITAHNLRAPVATILGLGNVLDLASENPDEKKVIYDKLIFTTKELDRVVRDLNAILDIRKNSTSVSSEVDLDMALEQVSANLDREIKDTGAKIECDFTEAKVINAVKPYLDSVLFNLVSNAIKYRHPTRSPHIFLKTQRIGSCTRITIADNGIGIDLKLHKEKVFTLYSRFHTHVEGKGLGLHMVKTQLAAMGGTIEIESEVDKGTTFSVYVPVK